MIGVVNTFFDLVNRFLGTLFFFLPDSPFSGFISSNSFNLPYLGYLNWFVPVGWILNLITGWLVAIALYYGYKWLAHYLGFTN